METPWQRKLLLTGPPGCGKTTVVQRAWAEIRAAGRLRTRGFLSEEMRDDAGRRVGFRLVTADGGSRVMAHVDFISNQRVGRYGVDVENVHYVSDLHLGADPSVDLIVIDEIGKMELLSDRFTAAVKRILASDQALLATIPATGRFRQAAAARPGVTVVEVTAQNRDRLAAQVVDWATAMQRDRPGRAD